MRTVRRGGLCALPVALVALTGTARAECLGSCADAMFGALFAMVAYGLLGVVALVMLARAKWRRRGVMLVVAVTALAVGLPLISQAWQSWKHQRMQQGEIVGTLPDLSTKTVLFLSDGINSCYYNTCSVLLWAQGEDGVLALPIEALAGLDLSKPLALADLPLEVWQRPADGSSTPRGRPLTPSERQEAAGRVDYLVLVQDLRFSGDSGPVEAALAARDLGAGARVRLALAPITGAVLDLAGADYDLLDLWLADKALALLLAPYNTQTAENPVAGGAALAAQICPLTEDMTDWNCAYAFD